MSRRLHASGRKLKRALLYDRSAESQETQSNVREMASFKELRDLLVISYDGKIISDEEFLLLYETFQSKNPDFDYESFPSFDLDGISSA